MSTAPRDSQFLVYVIIRSRDVRDSNLDLSIYLSMFVSYLSIYLSEYVRWIKVIGQTGIIFLCNFFLIFNSYIHYRSKVWEYSDFFLQSISSKAWNLIHFLKSINFHDFKEINLSFLYFHTIMKQFESKWR